MGIDIEDANEVRCRLFHTVKSEAQLAVQSAVRVNIRETPESTVDLGDLFDDGNTRNLSVKRAVEEALSKEKLVW